MKRSKWCKYCSDYKPCWIIPENQHYSCPHIDVIRIGNRTANKMQSYRDWLAKQIKTAIFFDGSVHSKAIVETLRQCAKQLREKTDA